MTSVVVLVCMVALFAVVWSIRGRPTLAVVVALALAVGCVGFTWAWDDLGELTSLLGRDRTLTGRTPLWELLLELVWDRPWLGYGFHTFWRGDKGKYALWCVARRARPQRVPERAVGFREHRPPPPPRPLARCGVRAFVRTQTDTGAGPECMIWFILFFVIFTMNITESALIVKNDFIWVTYIVMSHKMASKVIPHAAMSVTSSNYWKLRDYSNVTGQLGLGPRN